MIAILAHFAPFSRPEGWHPRRMRGNQTFTRTAAFDSDTLEAPDGTLGQRHEGTEGSENVLDLESHLPTNSPMILK